MGKDPERDARRAEEAERLGITPEELRARRKAEQEASLEAKALDLPTGVRRFRYRIDLRYVGMGSELRIGLEPNDLDNPDLGPLLDRFHADYRRLFGYDYRGRHAIESLALRGELRVARLGELSPGKLPMGTGTITPRTHRGAVLGARVDADAD